MCVTSLLLPFCTCAKAYRVQLIPSEIRFDANATPAQYTDNGEQVIESGTHIRIKLLNTRSDVNAMFAIGSIKEDFLGYVIPFPSGMFADRH